MVYPRKNLKGIFHVPSGLEPLGFFVSWFIGLNPGKPSHEV